MDLHLDERLGRLDALQRLWHTGRESTCLLAIEHLVQRGHQRLTDAAGIRMRDSGAYRSSMHFAEWPDAPALDGQRVRLEPLQVKHAREMAPLLDDPELHRFIGGEPASFAQLQERYRRQVEGRSSDGSQRWFNWIVRRRGDGLAVGTTQATVTEEEQEIVAEVAWVVVTAHQGRGYARDAAQAMVAWLRRQGAGTIVAHVHPRHQASAAIARAVGLAPTAVVVDDEVRWTS